MATFINTTKNTATFINSQKGGSIASAGQSMGLLLVLTYSGGETLSGGDAVFINQTKN